MASLDFPTNPTNGQTYTQNGVSYYYNAAIGGWLTQITSTELASTAANNQVLFIDGGFSNGSPGLVYSKTANTVYTNTIIASAMTTTSLDVGNITGTGLLSTNNAISAAFTKANNALANATLTLIGDLTVSGSLNVNSTVASVNLASMTGALTLPGGTTPEQPIGTTPSGRIRFNNSINRVEHNVLGFWLNNQNGYTNVAGKTRQVFVYTGSSQTWTIPNGISYVFVKMWGAGGGGGSYGGWRQGSTGGAGGYSEGILPVVAGQTMTIRVPQCGYARWGASKAYPDGGGASTAAGDNQYCAAGGGSASIQVPNINSGTWCMFAGGGGGGGCVNGFGRLPGGAGGGLQGEDAYPELTSYMAYAQVGKRGTQSAGGAAPSGASSTGGAGSYNTGGTHQNGNCYGGGGGGGYYGGSSGCYSGHMSGGGGGSGFIHSSIIRGLTLTGVREYPPMYSDPDAIEYSLNGFRIGVGGDEGSNGGYGLVVVYY
jgi:hypothetical protein